MSKWIPIEKQPYNGQRVLLSFANEKCPLGRVNGTCCVTGKVPECWNLRKLDPVIRLME